MVAALTKNLTTVRATIDAVNFTATGLDVNDDSTSDEDNYPIEDAFVYRIRARLSGQDDLLSNPFSANEEGTVYWPSVLFPAAGTWTATVRDTADDSEIASLSVVVS